MSLPSLTLASVPPAVRSGAFHAYFVFDVAETIALDRLERVVAEAERAPLHLRREASSGFIAYPTPPVLARLPKTAGGFEARAKFFSYGVISLRISAPFSGSWTDFAAYCRRLRNDDALTDEAQAMLADLLSQMGEALDEPHTPLLEDYFVFEVGDFEEPLAGSELLGRYGSALSGLLLCEERRLTGSEQEEALRVNFSYFEDDLAVVQWDTAFVYDRKESANAIEDILEYANTQLAELRTYDALLDAEMERIYNIDPKRKRFGRREAQEAADRIRYLIVDVQELTDHATNALKIIGDAYYARLYRGAAGRLGLKDWQKQIDSKLGSVEGLYGFFNDQAQHARGEFLETIVIALIALEVVVGLLALRH
jgi:hypothetical protein